MNNNEKILIVDGVTKEYPGRTAVSNISFDVHKGSIHGFLGPNGAGKSTTMKMIAGLTTLSQGSISLFGKTVSPENRELKNLVGVLPENPPLYLDMPVEEYLRFVAKLHNVKNSKGAVEKVLTELSLSEVRKRLIGNLSKGFKQRVGLAQAVIYDAPFLILDEPTNGLDPQTVVELREFIKKLAETKTILFSSHILSEVEQLCDQITIIHKGTIRASGSIQEIQKKVRKGFSVRVGFPSQETLPELKNFGLYEVIKEEILGDEVFYEVAFESDQDLRGDLAKYLVGEKRTLLTLQNVSPELEDIFLQMTELKK